MLILTLRRDQGIVIGGDILVSVVAIRGDGKARLGIIAPPEIPVHREEVHERILRERRGATA